jgi:hypothetical protein
MIEITNVELNDESKRNLFVDSLLDKSGIKRNIGKLVSYIEDDISGRYTNINSPEEDSSYACYGGVIYDGFRLIEDGVVATFLSRLLTADELSYLKVISNGDLYLSVERTDFEFEQIWGIVFDLNLDGRKELEAFSLDVQIKVSTTNARIKSIASEFYVESLLMNELEHKRLLSVN